MRAMENDGERLCLTIPEVAKMFGISRNFAYDLVRQGKLPVIILGKRKLIPRAKLEKFLEQENKDVQDR